MPQRTIFSEGFYPSSNWQSNYVRASLSTVMNIVDLKDRIQIPYYGPKNTKPLIAYMPFRDLNIEDFVFMRPHDPDFVPLWMERTKGDIIKDEATEYFKMVRVQWWVPMKK